LELLELLELWEGCRGGERGNGGGRREGVRVIPLQVASNFDSDLLFNLMNFVPNAARSV